jgi:hypothetical protein
LCEYIWRNKVEGGGEMKDVVEATFDLMMDVDAVTNISAAF